MILIHPLFDKELPIIDLLEKTAINSDEYEAIIKRCKNLNIEKGNAILIYSDNVITVSKASKKRYNDLQYIGYFEEG